MSQKETFMLPDGRRTSDLKVTELKIELDKLGKSKSGKKLELLNRLNESFSSSFSCNSDNEKSNSVNSEIRNESNENDQTSYHKNQEEFDDSLRNDSRVVNIKKSNNDVDLDASDDALHDNVEINQSVDALDLYVPLDDSLNPADESQNERIQITISRNDDSEMTCEDDNNDRRVVEAVPNDERTVICGSNDSEKEEGIEMECLADDCDMKESKQVETEKANENIESETMENEADEIENIELETQIEMYEVDNIDLDGHMEIYDDHKDEPVEKNEEKMETFKDDNIVVTVKQMDQGETREVGTVDETEEGEVVSVPITARLGKRKVKEDSKRHSSPKKPKKKGLKETKGTGYIVEGPERVQPAQKSKNIISDVLRVDNLVRPFTLVQLQDMLTTQGVVKDVWLNKIKSVAYVRYESESVAINARENIDGCKWPSINPKLLACDFVFPKEMEWMKEKGDSGISPPASFRPQTEQVKPVAENDWRPTDKPKPANREVYKSDKSEDLKKRPKEREVTDSKRRRTPNPDHRRRHDSPKERPRDRERERVREKSKEKVQPAAKLLEDIFRKTVAQPAIYWLPVVKEKKEEPIKKVKEPVRVV